MKTRLELWLILILGLTAIPEASRADNLLTNGSFENPPGISTYQVFSVGNSLPGWIIESGTVEITAGTYWQTAEGAQSLDLNGIFDAIGTIYQDVATTPGHTYKVRFAYAGNPECGLPTLKTANAYWNSLLLTNLSFDISGHSNTNVGWIYYEQTVTATSSSSRIRFQATSPTFCGLTLDDVSVTPLDGQPGDDCISSQSGLVGWWRAEGKATDATGNLNGTTPFGIGYAPGVAGQAFDFNGTSRRVSLPDSAALKLTESMTIEGWIFIRSYGGFIVFRGDNRPGLDPYALVAGPEGNIHFHIESQAASVNLLAPVASNEWKHVAATLDGNSGDMRIYINGILTAEAITSVRPMQELDPNYDPAVGIGNHGGTFHQFPFNGLVDELALYNRALSPSEIQSIYAAGSAGKCVPSNPPPSSLAIPAITSINPVSATVGTTITISGTNFSPVAASNFVFFGAVRATVVSASATSLSVTVPSGATYAPITVTIGGLVAYAAHPFQPTFLGDGSNLSAASFAPRFDLAGGDGAHRSVIADLDGDGKPDIAVADVYGHTISLFRNISSSGSLSNGSFAPRVVLQAEGGASDNPYGFVAADMDGDGKPDLVACDRLGNHVSIYHNLANPGSLTTNSFAAWVNFSVGADPRYARVADVDGDGRPDIVSANYGANTISILRNIGSVGSLSVSSFAPAVDLPAGGGPYDVAIGDLDGDNKPDLAVVCADGPLSLYRNLASPGAITSSSFAPRVDLEGLTGNLTIALGDLDGDGKSDLVFGSYQSRTMSVYLNQASPGPFTTSSFAPRVDFSNGNWTHTVALGDLNGDGKTDIATVGELESYLSVFENLSTPGSFASGSLAGRVDFGAGWNAWGVSVGDLDGDGRPDVVFCNAYDDTVSVYQNLVSFTNAPPTNNCVAPPAGQISWWRWEGDGLDNADTNHGTLLNGAGFSTGKVGHALSLDGVNDHVRVADAPNLRVTTGLTVEAWIHPTSLGGHYAIVSKWDAVVGPGQMSYSLGLQPDGRAYLAVSPTGTEVGATAVFSSNSVPLNAWTYLAVTYDGAELRVYLNGTAHSQLAYTQGIFAGTSDLGIGANVGGTPVGDTGSPFAALFAGMIDEPGIYNRALSPDEIASLYAAGSAGKCMVSNPPPPVCAAPPAGLVSWWRGETAVEDSAGTNHGTLLNGASLATGKVGEAFSFDGVDDFVRIPRSPSLDVGDQVTVEFWMKADPTNTMNSYQGLVTSDFFGISIVNGFVLGPLGVAFYISTDGGASVSPSSYPDTATVNGGGAVVTAGEWHHVAGTYDGAKLQLYIDGQPWGVPNYHTGAISPMLPNSFVALGSEDGRTICPFCVNDRYFSGLIDEPAVYNRALSAAEIQGIYQAGSAGKCVVSNPPAPAYLLGGPVTNAANGHWYYLLDATNWPAAEQIAVSLGGHLATINNAAENEWVFTSFSNFGGVERALWIGLTDQAAEGDFRWISGDPSTFRNWSLIEPNNGGGFFADEDHALIWQPGSGYPPGSWNDAPSNQLLYAVVEVAPPSNHPPIVQIVFAPLAHLPGNSNHLVISPVCAPATVILDASRSADADHDALQFAWRQGTNIFATSCLVTNHLNPGIYQLELRVSDAAASPTSNFTLQVITPRQAVGLISNLVQSTSLNATLAAALLSPLRAAALAFDLCTASAGSDQLEVFQNRVRANEAALGDERADEFLTAAQEIICALRAAEPPALPGVAIQNATSMAGGQFQLRFTGEPGRICFIEATSDWVTWETIGVAAEAGPGIYEFMDVNAGRFPGRFYRAVSP